MERRKNPLNIPASFNQWVTDERALYEAILQARIEDVLKTSHFHRDICGECHYDSLHCGCPTMTIDPGQIIGQFKANGHIFLQVRSASPRRKTRNLYLSRCRTFDDGLIYYRILDDRCKAAITYHQCAMRWFGLDGSKADPECYRVCDDLHLEVGWVQRQLRRALAEQNKATSAAQPPRDTGCAGETGGPVGPSDMGGPLCSR